MKTQIITKQTGKDGASLHLFPLDSITNKPIIVKSGKEFAIVGITNDARISYIPLFNDKAKVKALCDDIIDRITRRYILYPNSDAVQFITFGISKGFVDGNGNPIPPFSFIYEVHAFNKFMPEFAILYYSLMQEATQKRTGFFLTTTDYFSPETLKHYLISEGCKYWCNSLIQFLQTQYNWTEYVETTFIASVKSQGVTVITTDDKGVKIE